MRYFANSAVGAVGAVSALFQITHQKWSRVAFQNMASFILGVNIRNVVGVILELSSSYYTHFCGFSK